MSPDRLNNGLTPLRNERNTRLPILARVCDSTSDVMREKQSGGSCKLITITRGGRKRESAGGRGADDKRQRENKANQDETRGEDRGIKI